MTEKQKRLAIIGGTVLIALLLLLFFRRGMGAAGAAAGGDFTLPAVTGPNLGPMYFDGGSRTYIIPGLDLSGPNLNMIGACCSDCMQAAPVFTNPVRASVTNVYNQGNAGPNIYNYYAPKPTTSLVGSFASR
jgi:hypothetical protein